MLAIANDTCATGKQNGNDTGWRGGVNVKVPGCTSTAAAEDATGKGEQRSRYQSNLS
jgi:hypothetical protein